MALEIHVAADLPPGLVAQRSRALAAELNAAGFATRPLEGEATAGTKGGELVLGAFLIEHFAAPLVEKLVGKLFETTQRDRSVKVTIKRGNREITIDATNMDRAAVAEFVKLADDTLG